MTKTSKGPLTVTKATGQARRITDRIMPNAQTMITSRGSWDLDTDTHLMITDISYPAGHIDAFSLNLTLAQKLPGAMVVTMESGCLIRITRPVN